ncbi:Telomeric repeat-binding factor 2-interacting protein 1 [Triplophysa tibetana]|uniref:Telomeric repeat-binding factor 2-interacting protein 1 n=1 Tax=Triplophysa tibetana TaxID=1572043 RepID=A0A5A9NVS0_9TELE|nr:Telomeric repeat-binding factor 2-interacting protein 1 [Triplophysa tibetana]
MSKTVKEEISDMFPVLFLDTSGQQMRFFLRPGPTKEQIAPLVTKGGGKMCRLQEPSAILLADPKDATSAMTSTGQTYISIQYIRDCVEQNQLLDMDGYAINCGPSKKTRSSTQNQGNGRLSYSAEDDAAILKFIEKRQSEAKGILVWKEMQNKKLTEHSWQSMKDRFKRHIQFKLIERNLEKCSSVASKRKALAFKDGSMNTGIVSQSSSNDESSQKSPKKSAVVSDSTQVVAENSLCPADVSNPQPSPERASSPPDVAEAAEEPQQGLSDAGQQESCLQVQEQETTNEEQQSQPQPSPETSKRPRLDGDCDEQGPEESNGHSSSLTETRLTPCKTSSKATKTLGILARAAREFEDSDGIDDESEEEEEGPSEASSKKPSDTHESHTALAREPESQTENDTDARQGPSEAICSGAPHIPDDERPGPSGTALTSKIHVLNSELQEEDHSQPTPAEMLPSSLTEIKQHVINLMTETKTDLVEVTKALLKANGDLAKAQVYLLEGYDCETHGPLWTPLDDEILLLADPFELVHLQSKYGEEDVTMRRAFLKADVH